MKKIGLIVFILALAMGVTISSIFSFGRSAGKVFSFSHWGGEKGSGSVRTERREVSGFKAVDVSGALEVEITTQKDFGVEVEADDNLLSLIRTEVDGETLVIKTEKSFKTGNPL